MVETVVVKIAGTELHGYALESAVSLITTRAQSAPRQRNYVVTANVDHMVELDTNSDFRAAYEGAWLRLIDGAALYVAARARNRGVYRAPGSDLMPLVCARAAEMGLTVGLFGGRLGAAAKAAESLARRYPGLRVVGVCDDHVGGGADDASLKVASRIREWSPDILFVGLGAPKQELWISRLRDHTQFGVALCIGAAIDFEAGIVRRAPRILRQHGLEWAYRLLQEPRRLGHRYLARGPKFLLILLREHRAK